MLRDQFELEAVAAPELLKIGRKVFRPGFQSDIEDRVCFGQKCLFQAMFDAESELRNFGPLELPLHGKV